MLVWFPSCIFLLIWRKDRKVFTPTQKPRVVPFNWGHGREVGAPSRLKGNEGERLVNKELRQQCRDSENALERKAGDMIDTSR